MQACGVGGKVSIAGVYAGFADTFPIGAIFGKGLQVRGGQTNVHRYVRPLLEKVRSGEIDPAAIITHHGTLDDAPKFYETFSKHADDCVKVVLHPRA